MNEFTDVVLVALCFSLFPRKRKKRRSKRNIDKKNHYSLLLEQFGGIARVVGQPASSEVHVFTSLLTGSPA